MADLGWQQDAGHRRRRSLSTKGPGEKYHHSLVQHIRAHWQGWEMSLAGLGDASAMGNQQLTQHTDPNWREGAVPEGAPADAIGWAQMDQAPVGRAQVYMKRELNDSFMTKL